MKDIEEYLDYRKYLLDYYRARKKKEKSFSYRVFGEIGGVKSPSLMLEIVKGKRKITESSLPKFIKGLELKGRKAKYFSAMVKFCDTKNDSDKFQYLEIMRGLKPDVIQTIIPAEKYSYYSEWYYSALREVACTMDWKGDYSRLARALTPPITRHQARKGVNLLLKLKFIKKNRNGTYSQTEPAISSGQEVSWAPGIRKLNHWMAGTGQAAIHNFSPNQRDISSIFAGISEKSYGLIKREIKEFKKRVVNIVDDDKATDQLYAINVQVFPLSEKYLRPIRRIR